MRNHFSKGVLLFCVCGVFFSLGILFKAFYLQPKNIIKFPNKTDDSYPNLCRDTFNLGFNGNSSGLYQQRRKFLPIYIVKEGDNLLSIAREQLGNTSRVKEIVTLNPSIDIDNPFIEVGWEILLPPTNTKNTSGEIAQFNGFISKIEKDGTIMVNASKRPNEVGYSFKPDESTILVGYYNLSELKLKDCISAVVDLQSDVVYSINRIE